ncbi:hypothetical protein [Bacillus cereus]|uniref:hypothetical protein n=1 Tax=Bacillus cereus TaxID=1396 RepID=UPI003012AC76
MLPYNQKKDSEAPLSSSHNDKQSRRDAITMPKTAQKNDEIASATRTVAGQSHRF